MVSVRENNKKVLRDCDILPNEGTRLGAGWRSMLAPPGRGVADFASRWSVVFVSCFDFVSSRFGTDRQFSKRIESPPDLSDRCLDRVAEGYTPKHKLKFHNRNCWMRGG